MPGFSYGVLPDGMGNARLDLAFSLFGCRRQQHPANQSARRDLSIVFGALSQLNPPHEKPGTRPGLSYLAVPARFELATSTMSRPIGRTKTRVDAVSLSYLSFEENL